MLRTRAKLLHLAIRLADAGLAAAGFALLVIYVFEQRSAAPIDEARLIALGLLCSLVWPIALQSFGVYDSQRRSGYASLAVLYSQAGAVATLAGGLGAAFLRPPLPVEFPLWCGGLQTLLLLSQRLAITLGLHRLRRGGLNTRYALIVGTGPRAQRVYRDIELHPAWGLKVIGFLDDADSPVDPAIPHQLVHKLTELPQLLDRDQHVDEVIVACPRAMLDRIRPLVHYCAKSGTPLTLLSDIFGDFLPAPRITRFDSLTALSFAPVHHDPFQLAVKRAIDIAGSIALLLLCAPLLGLAALAIRLSSPGPVLFRQLRCGLHGRRFEMLKLRTMVPDAERRLAELLDQNEMQGPVFKLRDDPRVTRVGRILRRTSIDELPQLVNVLRGDMSLVGPRPPVPGEVSLYAISERRRLSMRPGITCTWQVSGRNLIRDFEEWVELDLDYIDNWSLSRDVELLLRTIPAVLRGTGAK